jgi:hypothetical protein
MATKTTVIKKCVCDICEAEITNSYNLNQGVVLGLGWPESSTCTIEIRDIKGTNGVTAHHPDLCPDCARKILKKLMESLPCSPKVVKE